MIYSKASHSSQIYVSGSWQHFNNPRFLKHRWLNEMRNVPLSVRSEAKVLSLSPQTHWQQAARILTLCFHHHHRHVGHQACVVQQSLNVNWKNKKKKKEAIFCTWHKVDTATECIKIKLKLKVCCAFQYCTEHYGWWCVGGLGKRGKQVIS